MPARQYEPGVRRLIFECAAQLSHGNHDGGTNIGLLAVDQNRNLLGASTDDFLNGLLNVQVQNAGIKYVHAEALLAYKTGC